MGKGIAIAILTSCFLVVCGGGNEANTSKDTPVSDNPTNPPVGGGNGSGDGDQSSNNSDNKAPKINLTPPTDVNHGQQVEMSVAFCFWVFMVY